MSRFLQLGLRHYCVAGIAGLTVVLAGCGSDTTTSARPLPSPPKPSGEAAKPAATIVADSRKALLSATSVHLTGTFLGIADASTSGSVSPAPGQQLLDLRLSRGSRNSPDAAGTVTTVATTAGKTTTTKIAIIRVGGTLYLLGDKAYYARIGPKAAAVAGKWLSLPISQDQAIADLTDVTPLANGLSGASSVSVQGVQRIDSGTAVVLHTGAGATLYVAATGTPYPLRLMRAGATPSAVSGTLDFTDYNAPVSIKAPAGAVALAKVRR